MVILHSHDLRVEYATRLLAIYLTLQTQYNRSYLLTLLSYYLIVLELLYLTLTNYLL